MHNQHDSDQFTVLENKKIGRNIALYRRLREKKAFEVADYIGIGEPAYTKYERGEAKITVDFIQKVAEFLKIDPIELISSTPSSYFDNVQHSAISINGNSSYHTQSEQQQEMMLKMMENMILISQKIVEKLDKEK